MRTLKNTRTDLALEANELLEGSAQRDAAAGSEDGLEVSRAGDDRIGITRIRVTNTAGEKSIGKPIGDYITLEIPGMGSSGERLDEDAAVAFKNELAALLHLRDDATVLIVGLGNWKVTPDALGPKTADAVLVTRHIGEFLPDELRSGVRQVCALSPGVLGITGIETAEIIKGTVDRVHPDAMIVIDALASRKMERVGTTIQIANTGISPGSGIGNRRMEFSEATMGIPVLAIGIPTVIDAATIANDAIDMVIDGLIEESSGSGSELYKMIQNVDRDEKYELIQSLMEPFSRNAIVTPKQIDEMIDRMSVILANGLNMALHSKVTEEDINRYLYS